jgi:hypothetical protein
MSWISFITGGMTVIMAYAFISIGSEEEETDMEIIESEEGLVVTGVSNRLFSMLCPTCRKQKKFREIAPRVFECTRCKRTADLRIPS